MRDSVQREPVRTGVVERHSQLQQERDSNEQPVSVWQMDEWNRDQTECLNEQTYQDIRFTMPHSEEIDVVAEHAVEDLDNKWDHGDRTKNTKVQTAQSAFVEIQRVNAEEIGQNSALCEIEQRE